MVRYGILSLIIISQFIFSAADAQAQIWKKVKNKTKQIAEEKVSDKISDKLAEVVVNKMSEKFSVSSNPYKGRTKISKPVNLPDSYSFD